MKKLTKILSVIAIVAILVVSLVSLISCDKPVAQEDSTFVLEIRKANGTYTGDYMTTNPSIEGELITSKQIEIKAGQITVAEALKEAATEADGNYKIYFNDTDYIEFGSTWFIINGSFAAVPEYTAGDFGYSYIAFNGHYSNSPTGDFVDGLKVYTVVIDGWDGTIGA